MIKHVVMWRLKDEAEGASKEDNAKIMKEKLMNLVGVIEEIKHFEVGLNYEKSDMAFDIVLYSVYEDQEALDRYQVHPEHKKVGAFIKAVTCERVVVDYEV